jgi:hypothetical protein
MWDLSKKTKQCGFAIVQNAGLAICDVLEPGVNVPPNENETSFSWAWTWAETMKNAMKRRTTNVFDIMISLSFSRLPAFELFPPGCGALPRRHACASPRIEDPLAPGCCYLQILNGSRSLIAVLPVMECGWRRGNCDMVDGLRQRVGLKSLCITSCKWLVQTRESYSLPQSSDNEVIFSRFLQRIAEKDL